MNPKNVDNVLKRKREEENHLEIKIKYPQKNHSNQSKTVFEKKEQENKKTRI